MCLKIANYAVVLLSIAAFLCQPQPAKAQASKQASLADVSLEDLMNIEITSASKKTQRLGATAASVFVITSEDIRRSGISVLPELLRLAPGVQVARMSSGGWAIGIRGFNDDYSTKLLVLVDGRSVYNEFYSGVFWDTLNLPIDNIERIEVIRGPGAAMWGTNAVNGVINIITKSAKSTQGLSITGGGGSEGTAEESVRYGGEAPSGAHYRIDAQNTGVAPFQTLNTASPSRGWGSHVGDFRLDWNFSGKDSLFVSGDIYDSSLGMTVPVATISSPNALPADDKIITNGGNITTRWQHAFSETSSIEVRFSFDRMHFEDPQVLARSHVFDYGFQQHIRVGARHDLIWGFTIRTSDFTSVPSPALRFNPLNDKHDEQALFVQDEIALIPDKLTFVAGAEVSHVESIGLEVQPTGRLLWTPTKTLSTWVAVSRAVRTPSLSDRGLDYFEAAVPVPTGSPAAPFLLGVSHVLGNPSERAETVLAYEAGERVQASKKISFDVSTFYNTYKHLVSVLPGAPLLLFSSGMPYLEIPIATGNERHGESYGAELSTTWAATNRWRLTGGYSWLRAETHSYGIGDGSIDELPTSTATPHHQWEIRSNFDLTRTIQVDSALYYTAAMLQTGIPQHLRGDLRIGWRPKTKFEASVGVQDAFEANHVEFLSTRFGQISQVPRNFYGKAIWRF